MARSKQHARQRKRQKRCDDSPTRCAPPAPSWFADLMVVHTELSNELLALLDPHVIAALCTALALNKRLSAVLEDDCRWRILLKLHCGLDDDRDCSSTSASTSGGTTQANTAAPRSSRNVVPTVHTVGCQALADYVSLRSQLQHLRENITVIEGDIRTIATVGGAAVDCLVFPTSASFRNPRIGAAGVVHARAGPELDKWVRQHLQSSESRDLHAQRVLVSPGFDAGVDLLVHCAGPAFGIERCDDVLYDVYRRAFEAIADRSAASSSIACAAVASVSTGNLRFPVDRAAPIALAALRDVICERDFGATVALVCIETDVLRAFTHARAAMLETALSARGVVTGATSSRSSSTAE